MNPPRRARSAAAQLIALALIVLPVVIAGCNLKSGGFITSKPVHVRVFNAVVDGGQVTVTVGNSTVANALPFEGLTTYQDADSGNQEIKVTVGNGSTIVDTTMPNTRISSTAHRRDPRRSFCPMLPRFRAAANFC